MLFRSIDSPTNLNPSVKFGDLIVAGTGGKSVRQVLADANTAIGGGVFPSYAGGPAATAASKSALNSLISDINDSFLNCVVSTWATANLSIPS